MAMSLEDAKAYASNRLKEINNKQKIEAVNLIIQELRNHNFFVTCPVTSIPLVAVGIVKGNNGPVVTYRSIM